MNPIGSGVQIHHLISPFNPLGKHPVGHENLHPQDVLLPPVDESPESARLQNRDTEESPESVDPDGKRRGDDARRDSGEDRAEAADEKSDEVSHPAGGASVAADIADRIRRAAYLMVDSDVQDQSVVSMTYRMLCRDQAEIARSAGGDEAVSRNGQTAQAAAAEPEQSAKLVQIWLPDQHDGRDTAESEEQSPQSKPAGLGGRVDQRA